MDSIYPKLALCGNKDMHARTDTVFFLIYQVCTRGETLVLCLFLFMRPKKASKNYIKGEI